jgi:hypothetical protein
MKFDEASTTHTNPNGGTILKKKMVEYKDRLGRITFEEETGENKNLTAAIEMDALGSIRPKRLSLTPRQASSGSFLDPRVYTDAFACGLPEYDECFLNVCVNDGSLYGPDDGDLGSGSPTTPYPLVASGGTTAAPTPTLIGCELVADPDAGINTMWCDCPGFLSSVATMTSTTAPCAYTALPITCEAQADPDEGIGKSGLF